MVPDNLPYYTLWVLFCIEILEKMSCGGGICGIMELSNYVDFIIYTQFGFEIYMTSVFIFAICKRHLR